MSNDVVCHFAVTLSARNDVHYDSKREYLPHATRLLNGKQEKIVEAYQLFEKVGDSFYTDQRFKEAIVCFKEVFCSIQVRYSETYGIELASEQVLRTTYLDDRRIKDGIKMLEHVIPFQKEALEEKDCSRQLST